MKNDAIGRKYDAITVAVTVLIILSTLPVIRSGSAFAFVGAAARAVNDGSRFAAVDDAKESITKTAERTVFTTNPLDALTATPADIQHLIELAQEKAAGDREDGKITERRYTEKDANARVGGIAIRNNTDTQQKIDFAKYFAEKPEIKVKDKSQPAVLIFHTHTTESFEMLDRSWYAQDYITRSNIPERNMVRVGREITEQLENAGYKVIHDTEIHDMKYTGAYDHSRKSVEKYLKEYPSIQIVLDIHRDAIEQKNGVRIKPVAQILGKKAAQLMIITGCEEGKVKDFPNWRKNLSFALELQSVCEEMYPGLMRPVYFSQRKYNMDCSPNNLLVEVGSSSNTLEEAAYSGRLLGTALVKILNDK